MKKFSVKEILTSKYAPFILAVSLIAGVLLSLQIRGTSDYFQGLPANTGSGVLPRQYAELQQKNVLLQEQIDEYQQQLDALLSSTSRNAEEGILEELRYYRLAGGFTDVRGEGILIHLNVDDPEAPINMADLQEKLSLLINELNAAGAEAISINEERVVIKTEIRLAGIRISINGHPLSVPFSIKAIGNMDTLEAALTARYGFAERLRASGYFVEIKKSLDIEISRYNGRPRFEYAVPIRDE